MNRVTDSWVGVLHRRANFRCVATVLIADIALHSTDLRLHAGQSVRRVLKCLSDFDPSYSRKSGKLDICSCYFLQRIALSLVAWTVAIWVR